MGGRLDRHAEWLESGHCLSTSSELRNLEQGPSQVFALFPAVEDESSKIPLHVTGWPLSDGSPVQDREVKDTRPWLHVPAA